MVNKKRKTSVTTYLLLALVPYTRPNLQLVFHPNHFFNELGRMSDYSATSFRTAYGRAVKRGLIKFDGNKMKLSLEARQTIQPFIARNLQGGKLMVIFDIPEDRARLRQKLRYILKQLEFNQVQQSVWMTDRDYKSIITETIEALNLTDYVQLYEVVRLDF